MYLMKAINYYEPDNKSVCTVYNLSFPVPNFGPIILLIFSL